MTAKSIEETISLLHIIKGYTLHKRLKTELETKEESKTVVRHQLTETTVQK